MDRRAAFALVYCAAALTVLEYWYLPLRVEGRIRGLGPDRQWLIPDISLQAGATWVGACVVLFLIVPFLVTMLAHRDLPRTIGCTGAGFLRHVWIYLLLYAAMLPVIIYVSKLPSFQQTYPFVGAARSHFPSFLRWEAAYLVQFFALEAFFRGYLLFTLEKAMGWLAIFVMAVPYGMIHWHKPAPEAFGAIIAGVILGGLALRTRSFFGGALLHGLVALTMDTIAATRGGAL